MSMLLWMLVTVVAAVVGAEAIAWTAPFQRWLLRRTVNSLPAGHADRYYEEWLAELEEVPAGPITRTLWVLRLFFARRALAQALGVSPAPRDARTVKRAFDVGLALSLLVFLAPAMVAVTLAVRISTGGPVLFREERVGRAGRPFSYYRFRILARRPDAEGNPHPSRLGLLLHRISLDELPALFNVLAGDMAFVGPASGQFEPDRATAESPAPGLVPPRRIVGRHRRGGLPPDSLREYIASLIEAIAKAVRSVPED
jgi:hypothetical protein